MTCLMRALQPSIVTSPGIALEFRLVDATVRDSLADWWETGMGLFTSGLGARPGGFALANHLACGAAEPCRLSCRD